MSEELQWFLVVNAVFAIWLGMLAQAWKGRSQYRWIAVDLVMSAGGLVVLVLLPKVERRRKTVGSNGDKRAFVGQDFWRLDA